MPFDNLPAERDEAMAVFTITRRRTRAFDVQHGFTYLENPDGPIVGAVDGLAVRGRCAGVLGRGWRVRSASAAVD